jgi:carbon monoxide dehydrogenase subunit G
MKLEQSFEVAAPIERVWAALVDVEHVAPCLPGAAVTGRNEDGSYSGTFKVKIGPTSAAYSGRLVMENIDEAAHTATMNASGTDRRGQGGARAMIVSTVSPVGEDSTRVEVVTDYHITGRLARFGRGGMIEDISNKLLGQFAERLQESLRHEPEGEAVQPEPEGVEPEPEAPSAHEAAPPPPPPAPAPLPPPAPAPLPPPAPAPLLPPVESEPVQGLSLVGSALWSQAKQNPAPLVALVLGFLLALRVLRRRG